MEPKIHRRKFITCRVSTEEKRIIMNYVGDHLKQDLSTYIREKLLAEIPPEMKTSVS